MPLLKYLKSKTALKQSLLDPNGDLSKKIPSLDISSANACLGKLLQNGGKKNSRSDSRGPYTAVTAAQKFDIGKRAAEIGTTAAMHYYAKRCKINIGKRATKTESTR